MMRFDRFTERAQEAAQRAAEIIQRYAQVINGESSDTNVESWLSAPACDGYWRGESGMDTIAVEA